MFRSIMFGRKKFRQRDIIKLTPIGLYEDDTGDLWTLKEEIYIEAFIDSLGKKGAMFGQGISSYDTRAISLHTAIDVEMEQYDQEFVERLISDGSDCNVLDENGYAPLHYALKKNNFTATKALLLAGANVNLQTNPPLLDSLPIEDALEWWEGMSFPIHLVIPKYMSYGEDYQIKSLIEILLTNGADCNWVDSYGLTPLHLAVRLNDTAIVGMLLDAGANVNLHSQQFASPYDDLSFLLGCYGTTTVYGGTQLSGAPPMFIALDVSILKLLLSKNANLDVLFGSGSILHWSIMEACIDIAKYLISDMPFLLHLNAIRNISPIAVAVKNITGMRKEIEKGEMFQIIHLLILFGCDLATEVFKSRKRVTWKQRLVKSRDQKCLELLKIVEEVETNPRSLLDLCTLRIRSILQRNVIVAVDSLPVPAKLKDTLTLANYRSKDD